MSKYEDIHTQMQAAAFIGDKDAMLEGSKELTQEFVKDTGKAFKQIKQIFGNSEPPPPPKSSGSVLGGLLALGALAGGAYLLNKAFGSSDKQKNTAKTANNSNQNASSYLKRGNTYLNQQKYELAIQEFSRAIQISPNYALAYKGRGKCYQALGDQKNAQADFSHAKKLRKKA